MKKNNLKMFIISLTMSMILFASFTIAFAENKEPVILQDFSSIADTNALKGIFSAENNQGNSFISVEAIENVKAMKFSLHSNAIDNAIYGASTMSYNYDYMPEKTTAMGIELDVKFLNTKNDYNTHIWTLGNNWKFIAKDSKIFYKTKNQTEYTEGKAGESGNLIHLNDFEGKIRIPVTSLTDGISTFYPQFYYNIRTESETSWAGKGEVYLKSMSYYFYMPIGVEKTIELESGGEKIALGTQHDYRANVLNGGSSDKIIWTVEGEFAKKPTIDASGKLTVGADVACGIYKIVATLSGTSIKAEKEIKIYDAKKISTAKLIGSSFIQKNTSKEYKAIFYNDINEKLIDLDYLLSLASTISHVKLENNILTIGEVSGQDILLVVTSGDFSKTFTIKIVDKLEGEDNYADLLTGDSSAIIKKNTDNTINFYGTTYANASYSFINTIDLNDYGGLKVTIKMPNIASSIWFNILDKDNKTLRTKTTEDIKLVSRGGKVSYVRSDSWFNIAIPSNFYGDIFVPKNSFIYEDKNNVEEVDLANIKQIQIGCHADFNSLEKSLLIKYFGTYSKLDNEVGFVNILSPKAIGVKDCKNVKVNIGAKVFSTQGTLLLLTPKFSVEKVNESDNLNGVSVSERGELSLNFPIASAIKIVAIQDNIREESIVKFYKYIHFSINIEDDMEDDDALLKSKLESYQSKAEFIINKNANNTFSGAKSIKIKTNNEVAFNEGEWGTGYFHLSNSFWKGKEGFSTYIINPNNSVLQMSLNLFFNNGSVYQHKKNQVFYFEYADGTIVKSSVDEWGLLNIPTGFEGFLKIPFISLEKWSFGGNNISVNDSVINALPSKIAINFSLNFGEQFAFYLDDIGSYSKYEIAIEPDRDVIPNLDSFNNYKDSKHLNMVWKDYETSGDFNYGLDGSISEKGSGYSMRVTVVGGRNGAAWGNIFRTFEGEKSNFSGYDGLSLWIYNPNDKSIQMGFSMNDSEGEMYSLGQNGQIFIKYDNGKFENLAVSWTLFNVPANFRGRIIIPFSQLNLSQWGSQTGNKILDLDKINNVSFSMDANAHQGLFIIIDDIIAINNNTPLSVKLNNGLALKCPIKGSYAYELKGKLVSAYNAEMNDVSIDCTFELEKNIKGVSYDSNINKLIITEDMNVSYIGIKVTYQKDGITFTNYDKIKIVVEDVFLEDITPTEDPYLTNNDTMGIVLFFIVLVSICLIIGIGIIITIFIIKKRKK